LEQLPLQESVLQLEQVSAYLADYSADPKVT